jgi:hypothetical protein
MSNSNQRDGRARLGAADRPEGDRRVVMIEVTATGRAGARSRQPLRGGAPLGSARAARSAGAATLQSGLGVLRKVFAGAPAAGVAEKPENTSRRKSYLS